MGESRHLHKCHQAPDSRMWPAQKVWLQPCRVLLSIPEGERTQAHKVSKALSSVGCGDPSSQTANLGNENFEMPQKNRTK